MEPGGATQSHTARTSWLDALLSARASATDRWLRRVCGCAKCVCVCTRSETAGGLPCVSHVFCQCLNDLLWPWNSIFSFGNILSIYRKQKSANSGEQSKQILSNILSGKFKWNYVYIYIKYVFKLHLNERRDEQLAKVIRGGIWHLVFLTFNSNLTSN